MSALSCSVPIMSSPAASSPPYLSPPFVAATARSRCGLRLAPNQPSRSRRRFAAQTPTVVTGASARRFDNLKEGVAGYVQTAKRRLRKPMVAGRTDVLQGTLELLVLRTLAIEPMHGWGMAQRIEQMSGEVFAIQQGTLYPALQRLKRKGWVRSRLAGHREQPPRAVLRVDRSGPRAARPRAGRVGAHRQRGERRAELGRGARSEGAPRTGRAAPATAPAAARGCRDGDGAALPPGNGGGEEPARRPAAAGGAPAGARAAGRHGGDPGGRPRRTRHASARGPDP